MSNTFTDPVINAKEIAIGEKVIKLLNIKPAKDERGNYYEPHRYNTSHGTKTALGIYRTLEQSFKE